MARMGEGRKVDSTMRARTTMMMTKAARKRLGGSLHSMSVIAIETETAIENVVDLLDVMKMIKILNEIATVTDVATAKIECVIEIVLVLGRTTAIEIDIARKDGHGNVSMKPPAKRSGRRKKSVVRRR